MSVPFYLGCRYAAYPARNAEEVFWINSCILFSAETNLQVGTYTMFMERPTMLIYYEKSYHVMDLKVNWYVTDFFSSNLDITTKNPFMRLLDVDISSKFDFIIFQQCQCQLLHFGTVDEIFHVSSVSKICSSSSSPDESCVQLSVSSVTDEKVSMANIFKFLVLIMPSPLSNVDFYLKKCCCA